jgi:hypothetical protein
MRTIIYLVLALCTSVIFAQDPVFVHTASAGNIAGDASFIDHPALNNNPNAKLIVTHSWNPPGSTGVFNEQFTGLFYSASENKWSVYNESGNAMIVGSSYNIYIGQGSDVNLHIADLANQGAVDSYTVLNHPDLNGNPNAHLFITTYYNPNGLRNNHPYGVWYDVNTDRWIIYAEDFATIPLNSAFFYAVQPEIAQTLTHTADSGNTTANWTEIDHTLLNNNPNAIVLITHNWGLSGASSNVIMDKAVGVYYFNNSRWAIFTEDTSNMPLDIEYDIMIYDPSLGIDDAGIEGLNFWPNPVNDMVNIQANEPIISVTLYNVLGAEVYQFKGEDNKISINLSDYARGVYLARIVSGNATQTVKLIKQ